MSVFIEYFACERPPVCCWKSLKVSANLTASHGWWALWWAHLEGRGRAGRALRSGAPAASPSPFRRGHDRQSLMARGLREAIVKRHEGQRLAHLALQIEATRELHRVTGAQAVAEQQGSRIGRNLWGELNDDQRGQVVGQ